MSSRFAIFGCCLYIVVVPGCGSVHFNQQSAVRTTVDGPSVQREGLYVDITEIDASVSPAELLAIVDRQSADHGGVDGSILIVGWRGGDRPYDFRWSVSLTMVVTQADTAPPVWNPHSIGWSIEDAIEKAVASRVVVYDHHGVQSRLVPGAGVVPVGIYVSYPPLSSTLLAGTGRTVEVIEFPLAADVAPSRIAVTRGWSTFTDKRIWIEDPQSKSERTWRFGPAQ